MIFTSRIIGNAEAQQLVVLPANTVDKLHALALERTPTCVLVDLTFPGLDIESVMGRLRGDRSPMPKVIAFGPHVEAAQLRAARAAGCTEVYPRSKFNELLPTAIVRWLE
jgi:CheY-like chemotaxis protein